MFCSTFIQFDVEIRNVLAASSNSPLRPSSTESLRFGRSERLAVRQSAASACPVFPDITRCVPGVFIENTMPYNNYGCCDQCMSYKFVLAALWSPPRLFPSPRHLFPAAKTPSRRKCIAYRVDFVLRFFVLNNNNTWLLKREVSLHFRSGCLHYYHLIPL